MNFLLLIKANQMTKTTYVFVFTNIRIIIFKSIVTYEDFGFAPSVIFFCDFKQYLLTV